MHLHYGYPMVCESLCNYGAPSQNRMRQKRGTSGIRSRDLLHPSASRTEAVRQGGIRRTRRMRRGGQERSGPLRLRRCECQLVSLHLCPHLFLSTDSKAVRSIHLVVFEILFSSPRGASGYCISYLAGAVEYSDRMGVDEDGTGWLTPAHFSRCRRSVIW